MNLGIDWTLLLGLSVAVAVDLTMRYFAFGHFESIALDAALFTTAYSGTRFLSLWGRSVNTPQVHSWGTRALYGGLIFLALAVIHAYFRDKLKERVHDVLSSLSPRTKTEDGFRQLEAAKKTIIRSVLLTFEIRSDDKVVRQGKLDWRRDAALLANSLAPKGTAPLSQEKFLLPRPQRLLLMIAFGIGLIASLLVATVTV